MAVSMGKGPDVGNIAEEVASIVNGKKPVTGVVDGVESLDPKINPKAAKEAEKVLGAEETKKEAEKVLGAEETKEVLDKMKEIKDYINSIPGDKLNDYKGAILEYNLIIYNIQQKMEDDPNFKEAVKQMGGLLDNNDQPLNEIGEPTAGEMVSEALRNKETPEQIEKANYVISRYDMLNPSQQEALNRGLASFKDRIENVAKELRLDEVRKVA